ncbi:MAG: adenosylcobalamin-dependent ribonucleoside-diphosphate reductase [Candidatus Dojkabacteria bacterium]|nr:MAG: adenosylcobalamin-dependent ribonucleoside-diphosphate reductase [Candidatus Dojkabacteria bacterium]
MPDVIPRESTQQNKGLSIDRVFTTPDHNRLEEVIYERRMSKITDAAGKAVFEKTDVEVPISWSQVATDVLAQKYFRKKGVPKIFTEMDDFSVDDSYENVVGDGNHDDVETTGENSIKQVAHRLAGTWAWWGHKYGYFKTKADAEAFYDEVKYTLISQIAAPNSPQWFNTGLHWAYGITGPSQGHWYVDPDTKELTPSQDAYSHPQPHACFIQEVNDDLVNEGGIFDLITKEARIFKYGSGTGTNFSALREEGAPLSGGGTSSGVMSFLSIFDRAAASVKSGGTTRRAAKMVILNIDHPDIEKFINWKVKEEQKVVALVTGSKIAAKHLKQIMQSAESHGIDPKKNSELKKLIKAAKEVEVPLNYIKRVLMLVENGVPSSQFDFASFDTDFRSEAYTTVDGQNSNNTVRVTNEYMEAIEKDGDWELTSRINGKVVKTIKARDLWNQIGNAAWQSADPGLQFDTTINDWHTSPQDGRINGSNPCSEYMFLDETACNLASINLDKFYDPETQTFDVETYRHVIRLWTIILEVSVLMAQLPSAKMAERTYKYRTLGLGYANLGTVIMKSGLPYDSDEARGIAGSLTAVLTGESYATSAEMAQALGTFERFDANRDDMLRVIRNHRLAAYNANSEEYENLSIPPMGIDAEVTPEYLVKAAQKSWDKALDFGEKYGYRNAQTTVIAPTGTIGLVMDCDTTGFEPDFALVKFKKLVGGGYFKIVNQSLEHALAVLGYDSLQIQDIITYVLGAGTLDTAPHINRQALLQKGFTDEKVDLINSQLKTAFSITFSFNRYVLGDDFIKGLFPDKEIDLDDPSFNLLKELGFSDDEIGEANEYICGSMTIEGAPHLKEEHYAVFDCATKCGAKGTRYIAPMGHVKMLAAGQPFISGSISKTVNLPEEATLEDIEHTYMQSWHMGLKCIALYRDGSKLSQPLSSSSSADDVYSKLFTFEDETVVTPQVVSQAVQIEQAQKLMALRRKLPNERLGITHKFEVGGHEGYITVGLFEDGTPGEIFLRMNKEGSTLSGIMDAWAISLSLNLQYGVPLQVLINKYAHLRFEPSGLTNNKSIPMAKSIVDYLARWLALKFLDTASAKKYHTEELVERSHRNGDLKASDIAMLYGMKHNEHQAASTTSIVQQNTPVTEKKVVEEVVQKQQEGISSEATNLEQLQKDQIKQAMAQNNEDAPICHQCGAVMVRNGSCYKCLECGTTTGCS